MSPRTRGASSGPNRSMVPAVLKAVAILDTLAGSDGDLGISEIAARAGLPRSSTFLLVSTLESVGYVERSVDGKYGLGLRLYEIGLTAGRSLDHRRVALPHLRALAAQTGFTCHMAVYDRGESVYIEKVAGPGFVQFSTFVGQRIPLHLSGVGKVLAAAQPEGEVERVMAERGLEQRTPHSISRLDDFKRVLAEVRQSGYAVEDEEDEIGIRCVAAPVRDRHGKMVSAISVTALRSQLPVTEMPRVIAAVKDCGLRISRDLGHNPGEDGL